MIQQILLKDLRSVLVEPEHRNVERQDVLVGRLLRRGGGLAGDLAHIRRNVIGSRRAGDGGQQRE